MPRPDQTPQLPKLPFLVGNAALLAAAVFIGATSHHPLATWPLVAVAGCVALGAVIGVIPFLTDYAREQDEAIDERQRALEALGATVTASAEQIGIAASGVHEIAELVQKNLRAADQLPQKLQEKIGEFTAQLTNARADETEELEKSLAELRASESERLAAIADKISRTATDLAKLEATAHKHLAATNEALAQLTTSSGKHFSELTTATAAAIAQAQAAAVSAIDEKLVAASVMLNATRTALLSELDAKLAAITAALPSTVSSIPTQERPLPKAPVFTPAEAPAAEAPSGVVLPLEPAPVEAAPAKTVEPTSSVDDAPVPTSVPIPAVTDEVTPPRKRTPKKNPTTPVAEISATSPVEIAPALEAAVDPAPATTTDEFVQFSPDELPLPAIRVSSPSLSSAANAPLAETAPTPSSDGVTRLLVTAYIGIGNRLFIRGSGGGLSWEKGVPLQFVSIGKWRWETSAPDSAITYKLLKNDALECTELGRRTLAEAHETSVSATF